MTARVLLAHGMLWPNIGRLAMAFRKAGFLVDALAPPRHPVHLMQSPSRTFEYRPTSAYDSVKAAIEKSQPDLIVPCDDRVVGHLHRLHKNTSAAAASSDLVRIASVIETSLGSPASYGVLARRSSLAGFAQLPGVHIPQTAQIDGFRQLWAWVKRNGLPAVLKLDGSFGGRDVILIRTPGELMPSLFKMRVHKSQVRRLKSLIGGEVEPFFAAKQLANAEVCVQSYIPGRLANCAVACWKGEVLASVAVEVLQTRNEFGQATVVRRVAGEPMITAASSIAKHLGLTGLVGFDFVLDDSTSQPHLIEINPRATQINHFPGNGHADLSAALFGAISNTEIASSTERWTTDEVALFPQEWTRDPNSEWFAKAFHDVPFEEPELLRYFANEKAIPQTISSKAPAY